MKSLAEKLIEYRDITSVLVHFTSEQINRMMHALPDQERRFARQMAETIRQPHEIWQRWVGDMNDPQQRRKVRYYLQFLDLSETEVDGGFGVVVMQFSFISRWELSCVGVVLGDEASVMEKINAEARQGSIEFSVAKQ